ncbi:RRXRR domain-containing protein [Candidatus Alkanophaga liquidiphilum]
MQNPRVPVVGKEGKPRMPTKASRARRWIKQGKAIPKWSKLGIFYVQLTVAAGDEAQDVVLGLDPGSKFDGVAVVSAKEVLQTGMLELPKGIARKMEQRRRQRRFRRYRKCRRRPCRFSNRKRREGWIAPSQKAKVDFRLKIVEELKKLYPINKAVGEDVRFDHYRKRGGRHFSTVEIGKTKVYNTLRAWFGEPKLVEGIETARLRKEYNAKKARDKRERSINSHAIDALVISANEIGLKKLKVPSFFVWKRYQYPRRQLHKFQFEKGGRRRREGGSMSLSFKKGDVVLWRGKLARVGGYLEHRRTISLHTFDVDNKRFTQNAKPEDCIRLFNQRIMYTAIPPSSKELPCGEV